MRSEIEILRVDITRANDNCRRFFCVSDRIVMTEYTEAKIVIILVT